MVDNPGTLPFSMGRLVKLVGQFCRQNDDSDVSLRYLIPRSGTIATEIDVWLKRQSAPFHVLEEQDRCRRLLNALLHGGSHVRPDAAGNHQGANRPLALQTGPHCVDGAYDLPFGIA